MSGGSSSSAQGTTPTSSAVVLVVEKAELQLGEGEIGRVRCLCSFMSQYRCLFRRFYQGQWALVMHPDMVVSGEIPETRREYDRRAGGETERASGEFANRQRAFAYRSPQEYALAQLSSGTEDCTF